MSWLSTRAARPSTAAVAAQHANAAEVSAAVLCVYISMQAARGSKWAQCFISSGCGAVSLALAVRPGLLAVRVPATPDDPALLRAMPATSKIQILGDGASIVTGFIIRAIR